MSEDSGSPEPQVPEPQTPEPLEIDAGRKLPKSLRKLLSHPDRISWSALWRALPTAHRESAIRFALEVERQPLRPVLVELTARQWNFRRQTIEDWPDDKLAGAARRVSDLPHEFASELIIGLHLSDRRDMLRTYLDRLGIPNNNGAHEPGMGEVPGEDERLEAAMELFRSFPDENVLIYFLSLAAHGAPYVPPISRLELASDDVTEPDPEAEEAEVISPPETQAPASSEDFTTLDRLMILATIDVAQGIEGSLTLDQLDDLVGELIELNKSRHRSFFHAGFLEALFDRPVREKIPAANEPRKAWYWAGRIQGLAREGRWNEIAEHYDADPIVQNLGRGDGGPSQAAAQHVCRALLEVGRPADAVSFLGVQAVCRDRTLLINLLRHGTRLLDESDPSEAKPFFDLLGQATAELERQGADTAAEPFLTIKRRWAHCFRRLGQFSRARELLESLLADEPGPNTKAMVLADLGVMAAGCRSVTEVRLPAEREQRDNVLRSLERGEALFREAVELDARYSAHGRYCLAIVAFLRENYAEAVDQLDAALPEFRGTPERYNRKKFLPTVRLYRALGICLDCQEDRFNLATEEIEEAAAAGAEIPLWLVDSATAFLGAAVADYGRRATEAIIEAVGDEALEPLLEAGLQSPALAEALLERTRQRRGQHESIADLRRALSIFLKHRMVDQAIDALDELSQLAHAGIERNAFIALLEDPRCYEPAWELGEALWERVRCLEAEGDYVTSFDLLRGEIHRILSGAEYGAVEDAEAILDHIRGYGSGGPLESLQEEIRNLQKRIDAARDEDVEAETEEGPALPVRIYLVGGDERQKKHQEWIIEELARRDADVRVEFLHSGWSGNWSPYLDEAKRALDRMDGVVMMRFMRTVFGQRLRKELDVPWRACHGSGRTAMLNSILLTARAARERLGG